MLTLSSLQKESLMEKCKLFRKNLEDHQHALDYLAGRGLTLETIRQYGLGYVSRDIAEPEDRRFHDHIAIPYFAYSPSGGFSVLSIRFRAIDPDHEPKYNSYAGIRGQRVLYNAGALTRDNDYIAICEGEIDTLSAEQSGISAVGLPGSESWNRRGDADGNGDTTWLPRLFKGYRRVYVLHDGDKAGYKLANSIAKDLPSAVPVRVEGDVNSVLVEHGESAVRALAGITLSGD